MWKSSCLLLAAFLASTQAGTVIWDGTFSYYNTVADFDKWSWANQVGEYQWYIHGSGASSNYLALDASYKNPAETRDKHGLRVTVDGTSKWNGAMERTELIPQTKSNLGSGQLYYHFSVKRGATNPPTTTEHQVVFFESHFTELKVGIGSDLTALNWCVGGQSKWSTPFVADVWHNFVYDINFSAGTVGLWHSTGSSPLTRAVANIATSTSTNSADWHVGVLRLGTSSATEQWYFSGVYIESGSLTTAIGSGSIGTTAGPTTTAPTTTVAPTTPITTTTANGPLQTQYGQCGGIGYSGPTVCQDPYTCKVLNEFYSQCL